MTAANDNTSFRELLDSISARPNSTHTEAIAERVDIQWTRLDAGWSDHRRPSLMRLEEVAADFGVEPCDVFDIIVDDVLVGDVGSGYDLLEEMIEWIVLASPEARTRTLDAYALIQRKRREDWKREAEVQSAETVDPRLMEAMAAVMAL